MRTFWQLQQPLDAIIFDCDGTLTKLEGINELAVQNGVGDEVTMLTDQAMTTTGVTQSLYAKRLSLVKPSRQQLEELGQRYFDERIPDIEHVIKILQRLGKSVFVISAGLKMAVDIFANHLNIPLSHVCAVKIEFDKQGNYIDFDHDSLLTNPGGKGYLVEQMKQQYPSVMHIGDGVNDLDAKDHVTRFVGYGGIFFRDSIQKQSDFYIRSLSLAPVLALALTEREVKKLSDDEFVFYQNGVSLIEDSEVILS